MYQLHSRTLHSLTVFETYSANLEENPLEIQLELGLPWRFKLLQSGPYDLCIFAQSGLRADKQEPVGDPKLLRQLLQSLNYSYRQPKVH